MHLIRLDERFRETTSLEWFTKWREVDPGKIEKNVADRGAFLWILRLGTFHPNGYYREKCVRRLLTE